MRSTRILLSGMAALMGTAAFATHYADATGDVGEPMSTYGNPNIDLTGLDITNTGASISFKFTTNSPDILSPDWVKLNVIMRRVGDTDLDTSASGNGWVRPYNMAGGAAEFIGGWVDGGGGFEARTYSSAAAGWNLNGATYNGTAGMSMTISGGSVTYTTTLASLNLHVGDTINFDAITSGGFGSDGAWDALSSSTATIANPGDPYTLAGNLQYKLKGPKVFPKRPIFSPPGAVPEPTTLASIGLGVAALLRRRRK